jgi:hypothetical protein
MGTRQDIEFTPEQKGILASVAEETGEPVSALIDEMFETWQERRRTGQVNGSSHEKGEGQSEESAHKPIWAKIQEAFDRVPEEEMAELPTDGAANVDYYAYGLPKRS